MVELATKADLLQMEQKLQRELHDMKMKLAFQQLHDSFERQARQLTINFGAMWVVAIVAVVIIVKLF